MVLYMPMARRIVESQNIKNIDIDDLYQMAYEALILCLDGLTNYKEFSAYLHRKINFHISKLIFLHTLQLQEPLNLHF